MNRQRRYACSLGTPGQAVALLCLQNYQVKTVGFHLAPLCLCKLHTGKLELLYLRGLNCVQAAGRLHRQLADRLRVPDTEEGEAAPGTSGRFLRCHRCFTHQALQASCCEGRGRGNSRRLQVSLQPKAAEGQPCCVLLLLP